MVNSTVAMENGHALLLGPFTVAAVHTVIRPVVPLAGKYEETLWGQITQEHIIATVCFTPKTHLINTIQDYYIGPPGHIQKFYIKNLN